jgi:thiol-disulfide isomerase/thioredoxin
MKILKFGAIWCPECLVMKPRFQKIEKEYPWLEIEYFEIDEPQNEEIVEQYKVENPPVFVFLDKEGKEFMRLSGEIDRKELMAKILEHKDK